MDISVAIPAAYLLATGNLYTGSPGDANWLKMLTYFNIVQAVWAKEPGGNWESLYSPGVSAGTVGAVSSINLPTGLLKPSNKAHDYIYITGLGGAAAWVSGTTYNAGTQVSYLGNIYQAANKITNDTVNPSLDPTNWTLQQPPIYKYKTVPGPQLKHYIGQTNICAIAGGKILFPQSFTSASPQYGGTLYVPAFMAITPFAVQASTVTGLLTCDDPEWVQYYAAQEWAQVDVTLVQNVPSLIAKATDLMTAMKLDNQRILTLSQQTPLQGGGRGQTW